MIATETVGALHRLPASCRLPSGRRPLLLLSLLRCRRLCRSICCRCRSRSLLCSSGSLALADQRELEALLSSIHPQYPALDHMPRLVGLPRLLPRWQPALCRGSRKARASCQPDA